MRGAGAATPDTSARTAVTVKERRLRQVEKDRKAATGLAQLVLAAGKPKVT